MTTSTVRLCGEDIERPGHVCAFFDSREQEYETLMPYLREGVDDGEEILNVLDASRLDDHRARLDRAGIAGSGSVTVASSEEAYLAKGWFDMDSMVEFVTERLEQAATRGHRVRTAGWMDWLHRNVPGVNRAMEYEARMNFLFPRFDCTFMCVYDLARLDGQTVVDVMATHPWVILNGQIRRNSFYVPPDIYLAEVLARPRSHSHTA
jgi:hypothetical protein